MYEIFTAVFVFQVTSQYGMDWMTTLVCFGFMLPSGICILLESKSVDIVRNAVSRYCFVDCYSVFFLSGQMWNVYEEAAEKCLEDCHLYSNIR